MTMPKVGLLFVLTALLSYSIVFFSGHHRDELVDDVVTGLIPLLAGVVIAAVGVFLSSLSNLYSTVKSNSKLAGDDHSAIISIVAKSVAELRQNVLLLLTGVVAVFFLRILRTAEVPYIRWPIETDAMSKIVIVDTLILSVAVVSVIAVFDSVNAMFRLHQQFHEHL